MTLSVEQPGEVQRVNVLGVGISTINLASGTAIVAEAVKTRHRGYISVTGVHGVMEAQNDPDFRSILNRSFLCTPDGIPMVWMGRVRGFNKMGRVYGPDLMLEVCALPGIRHFLYGGSDGTAELLKAKLMERFPNLNIVGTYEPPWRPLHAGEQEALSRQIREAKPDILWVGLSTPKQEKFMSEYLPQLEVTLMVGVGAAFDIHSGRVRQAPRWMQRSGLEWFFRLCQEPRRLWRRYLKNNPRFLYGIVCQLTGLKRYPLS